MGICPPSNHTGILPPVRALWPLWPRPDVPPTPVAVPLPRRFESFVAPAAGRMVPSLMRSVLLHLHQVADLEHHAPDLGRVVVFHGLLHVADPQRAHGRPLDGRMAARALRLGDLELARHGYRLPNSSSTVRPRMAATSDARRRRRRPSTVAFTRLCGLRLPRHFLSTFCTPATSSTARTPAPAITPVPGAAGLIMTSPAP